MRATREISKRTDRCRLATPTLDRRPVNDHGFVTIGVAGIHDLDPAVDVILDTSAHVTYTEEEPNALAPEEVGPFLAAMRDRHPQHLGMVALGFATGWRPSMMRPLRRGGPSADVLWDKNVVLARRSQTRGDEVREATKNSTRFRITLPPDAMAVLRWHADRLPAGRMQESDLLFPSETGGFRSPTVLDKPFKDICQHLSLGKKVTPKGDAPDLPRPRPAGGGRRSRPAQHLRPPHRRDDRAL